MKHRSFRIVAIMLTVCFLLGGCGAAASNTETKGQSASIPQNPDRADANEPSTEVLPAETDPHSAEILSEEDALVSLLRQMTIREKVGQLFIIRPDSLDLSQTPAQIDDAYAVGVTGLSEEMRNVLENYPVGGIVMFGKNIADAQQITNFIASLQNASNVPLFMAVDEEGGLVARLANHTAFDLPKYKSAGDVGKSGDPSDAYAMGSVIGTYLYDYGFNMNFAPVADVNTNPNNPVIGNRAFSSDAAVAAEMANAMAEGLKVRHIIPVFKHFPGHGDTAEDSHSGIAISYKTKEEMENCEWLPYASLTGEECVMIGHIAAPNITGDLTPATMSYEIVNDILRQQLNFNGVVITDSLTMGAITEEYSSGEAAVKALEAGCDILLGPENLQEAFEAVVDAVENGTISEERIDESVYRILALKKSYGLLN